MGKTIKKGENHNKEEPKSSTLLILNLTKRKKKYLPENPGKFGISAVFGKILIREKRKPLNSESATSKTFIKTEY